MGEGQTCCGCSLRTGTIIAGIVQLILSIIMLIVTYALDIAWEEKIPGVDHDIAKIIATIVWCIGIFTATLFLVGVYKRNTFMMLPWLGMMVFGTVILVIYTSSRVMAYFLLNNVRGYDISVIEGCIGLSIFSRCGVIGQRYYKQLKNENMYNYQQQA